ncbi:hypothetical protein WICPIJ_004605 [Wickerhamomyces pijperi]|uniref:GPI ethanolamine phosphate transferase 2 n=1 Tax=Wickerhamomyces pijperi TaxID=599730 RepID=A0A9P8Q7S8_WICPI|nr:hypothetical protein WICPIJ_004605 [Wickerhamomyces pijperi]
MNWLSIITTLLVQLAGILVFCIGFFPSKTVLQGHGSFLTTSEEPFTPQFDRVIVMVVDALRSDFMFSEESQFHYVHKLIRDGSALGFTAFANPPTVTLPRLKGITTGTTPNFLDAVLNVVEEDESNSLSSQDSWLYQLKSQGKKIHMYGDDTWIKLFPGMFDTFEGTSSFFVSDFTEVDNNVTRHLDTELNSKEWDCLILHYLGLDHIGHKGGPNSIFMKPKQQEMDSIVERIHRSMDDRTLLVVLGDHGMNEIGNHGGSSHGETSAALAFISDKFQKLNKESQSQPQIAPLPVSEDYQYYNKIQQIDIVPTLAGLLRFPIPKNSLGVFIRDFLSLWDSQHQRENLLVENLEHYKNFGEFQFEKEEKEFNEDVIYESLHSLQSDLTRSSTNYNIPRIQIGLSLVGFSFLLILSTCAKSLGLFSALPLFMLFTVTIGSTAFGSSLVEEEHQIWWWIVTLTVGVVCFATVNSTDRANIINGLVIMACLRFIRGWNTMGQKFIGYTFVDFLNINDSLHIYIKWILIVVTVTVYSFGLNSGGITKLTHPLIGFGASFLLSIITVTYKLLSSVAQGDGIPQESIQFIAYTVNQLNLKNANEALIDVAVLFFRVWGAVVVLRLSLVVLFRDKSKSHYWFFTDIHNLITILLIFQTTEVNIPIFLFLAIIKNRFGCIVDSYKSQSTKSTIGYITLTSIVLQNLTFFAFGRTNSLNTVDLSNAYNGVSSYDIVTVGLLTFLSNFSGAIYWSFATLPILFENQSISLKLDKCESLRWKYAYGCLFYTTTTLFVLGSCFIQRYHLFIWTVFSPKILYSIVWNFFVQFFVEFIVCGGIVWLSMI